MMKGGCYMKNSFWLKSASYSSLVGFLVYLIFLLFENKVDVDVMHIIFPCSVMISFLLFSLKYITKHKEQRKVFIWFECLVFVLFLHEFLLLDKWISFSIQCILAILLVIVYRQKIKTYLYK